MASKHSRRMLLRQWQLVRTLAANRLGLTISQLAQHTSCSRATVYRDLGVLHDAGIPIVSENGHDGSDGSARHRLLKAAELPPVEWTPLQVAALHLARSELEALSGTDLVAELDTLLAKLRPAERQQSFRFAPQPAGRPDVLKVIESAMRSRRRARIQYRAASRGGAASTVHIEPMILNVADGEPYLRAFCPERGEERTYKIARIQRIELTDQRATHRRRRSTGSTRSAPADAFAHSIKVWTGEPELVRIKLDQEVAWLASEYPLPGQRLSPNSDGSAVIEARVSGLVEVKRWVLAWGRAAEALEPASLREATLLELRGAVAKYELLGPAKAGRGKSTRRGERRLTDRATGRG